MIRSWQYEHRVKEISLTTCMVNYCNSDFLILGLLCLKQACLTDCPVCSSHFACTVNITGRICDSLSGTVSSARKLECASCLSASYTFSVNVCLCVEYCWTSVPSFYELSKPV
jgi:hypothetical protein